jgi:hypothetical protein
MQLVLFVTHNRTLGPYLAAIRKVLIPGMVSVIETPMPSLRLCTSSSFAWNPVAQPRALHCSACSTHDPVAGLQQPRGHSPCSPWATSSRRPPCSRLPRRRPLAPARLASTPRPRRRCATASPRWHWGPRIPGRVLTTRLARTRRRKGGHARARGCRLQARERVSMLSRCCATVAREGLRRVRLARAHAWGWGDGGACLMPGLGWAGVAWLLSD